VPIVIEVVCEDGTKLHSREDATIAVRGVPEWHIGFAISGSHSVSATWSPGPSSSGSEGALNQRPMGGTIGSFNGSVVANSYAHGPPNRRVRNSRALAAHAAGRREAMIPMEGQRVQ